ncbi:hypothetical protein ABIF65_006672 [Bradyrhizobium japonicum]|jgi:hypothetical protein|nr:hypothetical protein BD122_10661 [Bradyrhizobium diazoefficiens]MCP1745014.1 hypothetical protein [Bradyrhizobium japonicum]MCP1759479.1 hypothetical protein [Bradyrhizobium japonicum]MCP1776169.1 hypothetical protein [Bradyrhizobium japonicum]MCP1791070.1 hypothetical protein [Bradyrhizobium japonicum]
MCILASCQTFTWEAPLPSDHSTTRAPKVRPARRSVFLVVAAIKSLDSDVRLPREAVLSADSLAENLVKIIDFSIVIYAIRSTFRSNAAPCMTSPQNYCGSWIGSA